MRQCRILFCAAPATVTGTAMWAGQIDENFDACDKHAPADVCWVTDPVLIDPVRLRPTVISPAFLRPRHILCGDDGKPFGQVSSYPAEDPETGALWVQWSDLHDCIPMGDVEFPLTTTATVLA